MFNQINKYYLYVFFKNAAFFSAVLTPLYTEWAGLTLFHAYILQSWFMLCAFVMEVPTGVIADIYGRKVSVLMGTLVIAVAAVIYGSVPNFWVFALAELLFAIGMALTSGADKALFYGLLKEQSLETEKSKLFGRANTIKLLAMTVAAPIGSTLVNWLGINAPMYMSAIPFLLASFAIWRVSEVRNGNGVSEKTRYMQVAKDGFWFLYRHPMLRWMAIDSVLVAAGAYYVIWLYQPLLKFIGVPISSFGWFHALLVVAEMSISFNFVRFEKLLGSTRRYLKFAALITSLSFISVVIYPSIYTAVLLLLFAGGIGLTRREMVSAYMQKHMRDADRATLLSFVAMLQQLTLVIMNPLMGWLAESNLRVAFLVAGLMPALAFLFTKIRDEMFE